MVFSIIQKQIIKRVAVCLAIGVSLSLPVPASATKHRISPNVPFESYVYSYIEKLDGLGYLSDMQTGTKPYSRFQIAKWIKQIEEAMARDPVVPVYARNMLHDLQLEFSHELETLNGNQAENSITLKEISFSAVYYDGNTLDNRANRSKFQPLNTNSNGYRLGKDGNAVLTGRIEGSFNNDLLISSTTRVSYDEINNTKFSLESGYMKTHINNVEIMAGKDPLWWGQGSRGTLSLTNNATPQTTIKLSSIEPKIMGGFLKFLGQSNTSFFYSILESNRSDVKYPSFVGTRKDFTPGKNFTFAVSRTSMVGGQGHMLHGDDYIKFLPGANAITDSSDKWNSIAGLDFRWRLPKFNGLQVYGEFYGEDQAKALGFLPTPSKMAEIVGVYIPRLSQSGNWDAQFEWGHTSKAWYGHWLYTDGYTYKGNLMADAMGNNADRYYAKLAHYADNGVHVSLNFERLVQTADSSIAREINSVWLSSKINLEKDMYLKTSAGIANVKNTDFKSGNNDKNYLFSATLVKSY